MHVRPTSAEAKGGRLIFGGLSNIVGRCKPARTADAMQELLQQ